MRIAVCLKEPDPMSEVSEVFGRSGYFLIYDSENDKTEILLNSFASELGGAGILSASLLIGRGVDSIIARNIGRNPLRLFSSANIRVYQCNSGSANDIIGQYLNNELNVIEVDHRNTFPGRRNRYGRMLP
jgi:predicted Fe-Mo cluster-binding NifX family protein